MKILHTADWHLGQTLRGYGREKEQAAALAQVVEVAREEAPVGFVLSGDVFDTANPSADAQRLYYRTLVQLRQAVPDMTIVVTAGNHDAAGRLEAPQEALRALGVHVVGSVKWAEGRPLAEGHLVEIGKGKGHVLAVSYPTAHCLPGVGSRNVERQVAELYSLLLEPNRPRWEGLPLLAMGHLTVAGGQESPGAERLIHIGGEDAVPSSVFPAEINYVALGHLHRAQALDGGRVQYSGSLIPLSAAEAGYEHGVTIVEWKGSKVEAHRRKIARSVGFHRVPDSGYLRRDEVEAALRALGGDASRPVEDWPYVQLRLEREGLTVGFQAEMEEIGQTLGVRLVEIKLREMDKTKAGGDEAKLERVADLKPDHFFEQAFFGALGREPEERHRRVFEKVLTEVQQ